jgi:hypothetical protein
MTMGLEEFLGVKSDRTLVLLSRQIFFTRVCEVFKKSNKDNMLLLHHFI